MQVRGNSTSGVERLRARRDKAQGLPKWALAWAAATLACGPALAIGAEPAQDKPGAVGPGTLLATGAASAVAVQSNALLRPTGSNTFALGPVQLNVRERTVSFPAVVNMEAGLIEYLLVTTSGKTHESLLRTDVAPHQIQLALLLLGARGAGTNAFPQSPAQPLPGEPVTLELVWTQEGQPKRIRAEAAVRDRRRRGPAQPGPWVYTGSRVVQGTFVADLVGSIVAVMEDPDALINNPRPGREDDENWEVQPGVMPSLDTPVQVVIKLESGPIRQ